MDKKTSDFFSRTVLLPSDTPGNSDQPFDPQSGGNELQPRQRGDKGIVQEVFPTTHTYTVATERSGTLSGVQRIAQAPGDKVMLPVGTTVCVTYDYGDPMIVGVLNYTTGVSADDAPKSLTGVSGFGADDPTQPSDPSANFRDDNAPRDLSPDDWAYISPLGNGVAVLDGGVNVIKSSDFAQIRTHLINDVVEMFSHKFRHITSMGISEVSNAGGRASWSFRGGTDQLAEAGADQENWTIRVDLGASGDLFNFELTEPDGTAVFRLHVSPDGKADLYAAKGLNIKEGEQSTKKTLQDEVTTVTRDATRTIGGAETQNIRSSRTVNVASNDTRNVGNDRIETVFRNLVSNVNGSAQYTVIGGDAATATPLNEALVYEIVNGSWVVSIGDPTAGANPAARASFDLTTNIGDIALESKVQGDAELRATAGNVTAETVAGNATLKTSVGIANVDGTQVTLGPTQAALANPVLKGTLHNTALDAFLSTNTAAYATLTAATGVATGALSSGPPSSTWVIAAPIVVGWLSALTAALGTLLGSNAALTAALPGLLSTKTFTA